MLKIKDNVDLKELQGFDFEEITVWGDDGWVYDFTPYTKEKCSFLVIHSASREIIFDHIDFFKDSKKCFDLIYDLIKANLVEKVGGESK